MRANIDRAFRVETPEDPAGGGVFLFMRGREALAVALKNLGVGQGDEVILQGFTCLAVPAAILSVGARPVYADINPATLGLTADSVSRRFSARTRAVVAQHTFGRPCDIERISLQAGERGIHVIEDCAHTLPSSGAVKKLGSYGVAAFFSTEWAKVISTGHGGVLALNGAGLAERVRQDVCQSPQPKASEILQLRLMAVAYRLVARPRFYWYARSLYRAAVRAGLFSGNFQAGADQVAWEPVVPTQMSAWQRRKLERGLVTAESRRLERLDLAGEYSRRLRKLGIWTWSAGEDLDSAPIRLPLWVDDKELVLDRARRAGVEMGDWFSSVVQPVAASALERVGYASGQCPVAERAANHVVNVILRTGAGAGAVDRVSEFVELHRARFGVSPGAA